MARSGGRRDGRSGRSRAPRPVTISCSMVSAHVGPLGDGRLAVVAGPEDGDGVARLVGTASSGPRSTTAMSMEIRPTSGRRRPRTSTSARPEATRGRPSAYPSGSRPSVVGSGAVQVCPYPTGVPARTRRTPTSGAVRVSAGCSVVVRDGSMPTRPAPTRHIVWWLSGSVRVAEVAARCRSAGRRPQARATSRPQAKRVRPTLLPGSSGVSASARWPITPTTSTSPRRSASRAARHRSPQADGAAPSRAMPVSSCRWMREPRARATTASRCSRPGTATSTSATRAAAKSASTGFSQLSDRRVDAGGAQGERLVDRGDAEAGGAVGEGGTGDVDRPVPEAVGLDDGHQLAGGAAREGAGVRADGGQVHEQPRAGAPRTGPQRKDGHAASRERAPSCGPYTAYAVSLTSAQYRSPYDQCHHSVG